MATGTLTGQTIANTYKSILKVTGTTAGGETLHATTLKVIEDGDGNPTPIQLAQNRIEIVPTANHANAFEVSQTDGTQILNINSTTPAVSIVGNATKLYFYDDGDEYISADASGVLSIAAGAEIDLTATAIDINGAVAMDGAITGGTNITISGELDAATLDISGAIDVAGTANLDIVDIDGAVDMASTLTIGDAVTITKDTDAEFVASILVNQSDAASTAGIVSQRFDLEDTGGTAVDSGKILVGKEASFTATASTQDSYMAFHTSLNGSLVEAMRITSAGQLNVQQNIKLLDDKAITLGSDGDAQLWNDGSNTYIRNNTSNQDIVFRVNDDGSADTEVMRIDASTSRVGIGTDSPDFLLDCEKAGSQIIRVHSTDNNAGVVIASDTDEGQISFLAFASGADYRAEIKYDHNTTAASQKMQFKVGDNAVTAMTILGDGNVGIGDTDPSEAKLSITGVQSGDAGIKIRQTQNNYSLEIDADSTSVDCIYTNGNALTTGNGFYMTCNALTSGSAAVFTTSSTNLATTAAGGLVRIESTGDTDTNINNLLYINNDHADSSATTCLLINQDADKPAIFIDSEATTAYNFVIDDPRTTSGLVMRIHDANALTSGGMAYFYSNAPSGTARNLVRIDNDNVAADAAVCLYLHQDGDDAHIEFAGAGGGGIKFQASAMLSSDANTLDDYEEGTWTPTMTAGTVNTDTTSMYVKIGRTVTVKAYVYNGSDSSGSEWTINNLPFASDESFQGAARYYNVNFPAGVVHGVANIEASAVTMLLSYDSAVWDNLTYAEAGAGHLSFTLTYFTDS